MKLLVIGLALSITLPVSAQAASSAITLDCKSEAPLNSKFEGGIEVSKVANPAEPLIENETGRANISMSRLETEVLPDGSARQIEIKDQLNENNFQASSEFIAAGELFVHAATIVTLSSSEPKASIRIILEKNGANSTVVFNGARYLANCQSN